MPTSEHTNWAVSPLDGRYHEKVKNLGHLLSEGALMLARLQVEAAWLLQLRELPDFASAMGIVAPKVVEKLNKYASGSIPAEVVNRIKAIELETNHDVKAVEYFLREELTKDGATPQFLAFTHFACTSEDINNLAYGLMLQRARNLVLMPSMRRLVHKIVFLAQSHADLAMLSRTHGQVASPTTLGKELAVFAHRLFRVVEQLATQPIFGKVNGAVGNYNAHLAAFPNIDWPGVAKSMVEKRLHLVWNPITTQIENHDAMVECADIFRRFNTILIGFCRDIWGYVSLGYFQQELKAGQVGSSTMPHKINPIDFENAEGNLGLANALAQHFAEKLPISRWQRDLSDSTVQRSWGSLTGYSLLAYENISQGLDKLQPNRAVIERDLQQAHEVLGEAVQTVMRRHGIVYAYERIKEATRGQAVTSSTLAAIVDACPEIPADERARLKAMTPKDYLGNAAIQARDVAQRVRAAGWKDLK